MTDNYPATLDAAQARLAAFRPAAYARTRNALDGAVSGLSPYITHGFMSLTEVLTRVAARHELSVQHKFVYELGWRAYFRHVWQHRGDGILQSIHRGPLPDSVYATSLPADIREGRTGVPVIDEAVRELYITGLLHNHARMWLASYVVHVRKVHWRCGADWLYGHLLDGDLASNHLSWQWVAGTASHKPYLFNADNVARYAPASWHSPGTVIDTSYEALDQLAHDPSPISGDDQREPLASASPLPVEPPLFVEPSLPVELPHDLQVVLPDPLIVHGKDVWLVHPWNLGVLPALPADTVVIGLFVADFHRAWPWSAQRWRFVGTRMADCTSQCWYGEASTVAAALAGARRVRTVHEPHLSPWLEQVAQGVAAPALFPAVPARCDSFSKWWTRSTRGLKSAADLLAVNEVPAW